MTITPRQLQTFAESPSAFRLALRIDADRGPVRFGEVLEPWQNADFLAMDAAWRSAAGLGGTPLHRRAWIERPRGHSKSSDLALSCTWLLAFAQRPVVAIAAAVDRQQARLLRTAIGRIIIANPFLGKVLDAQHGRVVNRRTGASLEVLSSDVAGSFGQLPDAILLDELAHWPSRDLWDSLISAAAKRAHCVVVAISNAGFRESWVWGVRETVRQDPAWYFSRQEGPVASWITADRLEEQRRLLPDMAYRRLWLNEWSSGSGDALKGDDLDGCVTLAGPSDWERGYSYVGGLDLGLSQDHSALAVVGRHVGHSVERPVEQRTRSTLEDALIDLGLGAPQPVERTAPEFEVVRGTHRTRLVRLQAWRPPTAGKLDLRVVREAVLDAHSAYGLEGVFYDPHQCEYLAQELRRAGVRMIPIPFTASALTDMASTLIEAVTSGNLELFGDPQLIRDLRRLRIVERTTGGFRLDSPRSAREGHGDRATALTLAVLGSKRTRPATVHRPLIGEGVDLSNTFFDDTESRGIAGAFT